MQTNITNEIHGQHRSWAQFSLHAEVKLHGIGGTVAWGQKLGSSVVEGVCEYVADKTGVALGSCSQRRLLQRRFYGLCISRYASYRLAANLRRNILTVDRRLERAIWHGNSALAADLLNTKENSLLQSRRPVEE